MTRNSAEVMPLILISSIIGLGAHPLGNIAAILLATSGVLMMLDDWGVF